MKKLLQKIGIHRLVNEHTVLPESGIRIYGSEIDRLYYKRFGIQPMDPEYLPKICWDNLPQKSIRYTDRPQSGLFSEIRGLGSRSGASRPCPRRYGESSHLGKGCGVSQCETFSKI